MKGRWREGEERWRKEKVRGREGEKERKGKEI